MIDLSHLKSNTSGNKTSQTPIKYGTKDGEIRFGYLQPANINGTSATAVVGVQIQAQNSIHYSALVNDGPLGGSTINRSPGPYQIVCATDHAGVKNSELGGIGCFIFSENGDIVIRAPKGRVRISGLDVDIRAEGPDNTRGSINLDSNQSVNIKTGSYDVTASLGIRLYTPKTLEFVANTSMNFISNFTRGLTAASLVKTAKGMSKAASIDKFISSQDYF